MAGFGKTALSVVVLLGLASLLHGEPSCGVQSADNASDTGSRDAPAAERHRQLLQQKERCAIRDFNVEFTEANPDPNDELLITLPIFMFLDGVAPAEAAVEAVKNMTCSVGSEESGLRRFGRMSDFRQVEKGFMADCVIKVNNDNDCQWNVLEVLGSARIDGTEQYESCERTATATATYCKGELTVDVPTRPEPAQAPTPSVREIEKPEETPTQLQACDIANFNLEFLPPIVDPGNPLGVTFPLFYMFGGVKPESMADSAVFHSSCTHNGAEVPITNERMANGLLMFDCVVSFEQNDCSENVVSVNGMVEIPDSGDVSGCSRRTVRTLSYCDNEMKSVPEEMPPPVSNPEPEEPNPAPAPESCAIGTFNVEIVNVEEDLDEPSRLKVVNFVPFGGVDPPESASDASFNFSCTSTKGDSVGSISNLREVEGGRMFDCDIVLADLTDCSNSIAVEGSVMIPEIGDLNGCDRRARATRTFCKPPPQSPTPTQEPVSPPSDTCTIQDFNVEITETIPSPSDPRDVTFMVFAPFGGVSPQEKESEANFDFRCTAGIPGQIIPGVVSNQTAVEGGVVFQCNLSVNDANDCHWNVINIEGKVAIGGDECERRAATSTHYCTTTEEPAEECAIEELDIRIREAVPKPDDPLTVTIPVFVPNPVVNPEDRADSVEYDHRCTVGLPGQLSGGVVKNIRKRPRGMLFDCEIPITNANDCDWNLVTVETRAFIPSKDGQPGCERRATATTNYCDREPGECVIGSLDIDIEGGRPNSNDPLIVTFPVSASFGGVQPNGHASNINSTFTCSVGQEGSEAEGVVMNFRDSSGGAEFDCQVQLSDTEDCEGNQIHVRGTGRIDSQEGLAGCEKTAEAATQYCTSPPTPTCEIKDAYVDVYEITPPWDASTKKLTAAIVVELDLEPKELYENTMVDLKCTMGEQVGEVQLEKKSEEGFWYKCTFDEYDYSDCDGNMITAMADVKVTGDNATAPLCEMNSKSMVPYCEKHHPPRECLLDDMTITMLDIDSKKGLDGPFYSEVEAKYQVAYSGGEEFRSKLHFKYSCFAGGKSGDAQITEITKDGFIFACRLMVKSPWESLHTLVEAKASAYVKFYHQVKCGHKEVSTTFHFCRKPQCVFYPHEMPYEAGWGLITHKNAAQVTIVCSHPIKMCPNSFYLIGPQYGKVTKFEDRGDGAEYLVGLEWEEGYRGEAKFGVEQQRLLNRTVLDVKHPMALANEHPDCPVDAIQHLDLFYDLTFKVVDPGYVAFETQGYVARYSSGLHGKYSH